jgi:hypothetical protein
MRASVAYLVGRLGEARPELLPDRASEILQSWLRAELDPVAIVAELNALRRTGAADALVDAVQFTSHPDAAVRAAVAIALADAIPATADSTAIAAMLRLTTDPDAEVRSWAVQGLGGLTLKDDSVNDVLRERLLDDDDDVRRDAIRSLAQRGELAALESGLKSDDPDRDLLELAVELGVLPALQGALEPYFQSWPKEALSRVDDAAKRAPAHDLVSPHAKPVNRLVRVFAARMAELRPSHDEYLELLEYKAALDRLMNPAATTKQPSRRRQAAAAKRPKSDRQTTAISA